MQKADCAVVGVWVKDKTLIIKFNIYSAILYFIAIVTFVLIISLVVLYDLLLIRLHCYRAIIMNHKLFMIESFKQN